jgi:hypothetical protein
MLAGIIIDTYQSLKEELSNKIHDEKHFCFICGIYREKLDKSSDSDQGFFYHIKVKVVSNRKARAQYVELLILQRVSSR